MDSFFNVIKPLFTPVVILAIVLIFRKPLWKILDNISRLTDRSRIKIGDFEWTVYGLDQVVLEREKLRFAIIMASADEHFRESEVHHIANMAYGLNSHLNKLDDEKRKSILQEGVILAASDGLCSMAEYRVLITKCKELSIPEEVLYPMIREVHFSKRCEFDQELKTYLSEKHNFN